MSTSADSWESLRGDPFPWLLDAGRPNLHWRVLVDLVGRPPDSPAVSRARGGANAAEPIATLLRELNPDGTWAGLPSLWRSYSGTVWRLVAAAQWGADPTDPRLQAAVEILLDIGSGEGGFSRREGGAAVPWLTARLLHTLAELGWCRHPRFLEALAWLDEGDCRHPSGGWRAAGRHLVSGECAVTAVALLATLTVCDDHRRRALQDRASESLARVLATFRSRHSPYGHPCLGRTDDAEILSVLAHAGAPLTAGMVRALRRLQFRQREGGKWRREIRVPMSLTPSVAEDLQRPSRWVTLKCVAALMAYAVDARLPRMYPQRPERYGERE